jgi:sialate O-acetylesterase
MNRYVILLTLISLSRTVVQADLTVADVFANSAVLQRDRPLAVWGTADAGANVSVSLGHAAATAVASETGHWRVTLKAQSVSKLPKTLRVSASEQTIERSDILIGDVWHASGQSNMAMNVAAVLKTLPDVERRVGTFDHTGIRFLRISEGPSRDPRTEFTAKPKWVVCSTETVRSFSAAAFFFAATIHARIDVPIGIIDTSRGGTPIEPFIPCASFAGHPTLEQEREFADKDDLAGLHALSGGVRARDANWLPGRLFHSRVAPITDYRVRGCIWYQGESNCGTDEDPRDYQHKMRALVSGWRHELADENLPFYFVQLPGYANGASWPYLREQQRLAADIAGVGMVVTIDLVDSNIHPANKFDVGERLANWALAREYGLGIPFSGPLFSSAAIVGSEVTVSFKHADSGLMTALKAGLNPPVEQLVSVVNNFEVTADGNVWHPAIAKILGNTIIASSVEVKTPIAVRYAYSAAPENCNLYNRDGLPAAPFCSQPDLLKYRPSTGL